MDLQIEVGDVLDFSADVLISTANPWLNMSGGVNGAIRERCPEVQSKLQDHLSRISQSAVVAGTIVRSSAGTLPFKSILHAVAIDPFYDSSRQLVTETLISAFDCVEALDCHSVSLPTLATGYGPLSIADFGLAFADAKIALRGLERVTIVVRSEESAETLRSSILQHAGE